MRRHTASHDGVGVQSGVTARERGSFVDASTPQTVYAGTDLASVIKSTDGGTN